MKMLVMPGDNLWMEYFRGFIIPVTVTEVVTTMYGEDIPPHIKNKYSLSDDGFWIIKNANGISITGKDIYNKPVNIDSKDIDPNYYNPSYQGIWIDEIIGHELLLDSDNISPNFNEVFERASCVDIRQAKRRHKKLQSVRKMYTNWVNQTHINAGHPASCPLITTNKKIIVKTGKAEPH